MWYTEYRSAASLATVPGRRLRRRREPGVSFSRRDRASHTHVLGTSCRGPPRAGGSGGGGELKQTGWLGLVATGSEPTCVWTGAAQLGRWTEQHFDGSS